MTAPKTLYLEDLEVGQRFLGRTKTLMEAERIRAFGQEFDPQPFHVDDVKARDSIFKGLAASGWHTASVTMRLLVDSDFRPAGGIVGAGFDELRYPIPVRPGDELRVESELLEVRPSKSRPDIGLIKLRIETFNQSGQVVQIALANLVVQRRPNV